MESKLEAVMALAALLQVRVFRCIVVNAFVVCFELIIRLFVLVV